MPPYGRSSGAHHVPVAGGAGCRPVCGKVQGRKQNLAGCGGPAGGKGGGCHRCGGGVEGGPRGACDGYFTTSTGIFEEWITWLDVLPKNIFLMELWPLEPITTMSNFSDLECASFRMLYPVLP